MNLINRNPFRIAGILASASARELEKQKSRIARFASVGKEIDSAYDFSFLEPITRTEESANTAFSKIEQNQGRVNHALFWFAENGPIDVSAFEHLSAGDTAKAREIWSKVTANKEISDNNYNYFNNLGSLLIAIGGENEMKEGVALKFSLIASGHFRLFTALVADDNYLVSAEDQIEQSVEDLMSALSDRPEYKGVRFLELFANCSEDIKTAVSRKFTEDPIHNIENRIEAAKAARKKDPKEAYNAGMELYNSTQNDILNLRSTLTSDSTQFKLIADKLAKEVLQCGIDYFKALNDTGNPASKAVEVVKLAREITRNEQVLDRIKDNIEAMQEWGEGQPSAEEKEKVEQEHKKLTEALDEQMTAPSTLDNVVAFIKKCKPALASMKEKLGEDNEFYISMCSAVTNVSLNGIIDVVNSEQGKLKHNHSLLNKLSATVNRSVGIMNELNKLPFNDLTSQRFEENKTTIVGIKRQLSKATTRKAGNDIGNVIRIIISIGVLLFIIARRCS